MNFDYFIFCSVWQTRFQSDVPENRNQGYNFEVVLLINDLDMTIFDLGILAAVLADIK